MSNRTASHYALATVFLSVFGGGYAVGQTTPAVEFTTASGDLIEFQPVSEMDCDQMVRVLDRIGDINYRQMGQPIHAHDAPLLEYEDKVSAAHYMTCVVEPARQSETRRQFRQGFGFFGTQ